MNQSPPLSRTESLSDMTAPGTPDGRTRSESKAVAKAQVEKKAVWTPLVWSLMILTFTSGIVDAVSFIGFGRVFTALMTGNIAFIGFALAGTEGLHMGRSALALAAFSLGAVGGGRLAKRRADASHRRWLLRASGIEVAFLLFAVALALWSRSRGDSEALLLSMIGCTALAMGMRSATMMRLGDPDIKTTVLTLAIAGIAADSSLAGGSNPRFLKRLLSILALLAGALVGGKLFHFGGVALALSTAAFLVVIATLLYLLHPFSGNQGTKDLEHPVHV